VPVGIDHDLGAGLARAVGLLAAEEIGFSIGPGPLDVVVDLVARHDDHGLDRRRSPDGLQNLRRSHDVGRERLERLRARRTNESLRGKVEHDLGVCLAHSTRETMLIADITDDRRAELADAGDPIKVRLGRGS
jgi:hypothetical protein